MAEASPILASAHWIVILPFVVGALIILGGRYNKTLSMLMSVGAVLYGFIHSVLIFDTLRQNPHPFQVDIPWFQAHGFLLTTGVLVDNLASIMMIVVTVVSLLVQIYTHGYMREDPGYSRFYAYLSLFTGSMLGLVISTNLFQMYMFWELVGVCSYLLIGFWWYKPSAAAACLKAFVVNRIGDFGFLVGILLLLGATAGFWSSQEGVGWLNFVDYHGHGADLTGAIRWALDPSNQTGFTVAALTGISMIMFMGPMAKSAQAPLHVWLPDAMEGPTPISALIHAATMVAAGIYMVARAYPIWLNWENIAAPTPEGSAGLAFVAWIGGITAFMAATIALTQFDIKRALAWSTVSQLGYMFVGLGTGGFTGGLFHLVTHAFFKAMLFLVSGAVIHGLHGEQDMRKMGGLSKEMPISSWCFLIGCLAISGFPGFAGFFSKDEIIASAHQWTGPGHELLYWSMIITAGLTAFYMFRMYFLTFSGTYRGEAHPHKDSLSPLTMPLIVLAIPSVLAGAVGVDFGKFMNALSSGQAYESPFAQFVHFGHVHAEAPNMTVMGIATGISLLGIALAYLVYQARALKVNEELSKITPLYNFSFNKWYFDELYFWILNKVILPVYKAAWFVIDKILLDGLVNLAGLFTMGLGFALRFTENGRGQTYVMVIFAAVAGIALYVYFRPGG